MEAKQEAAVDRQQNDFSHLQKKINIGSSVRYI